MSESVGTRGARRHGVMLWAYHSRPAIDVIVAELGEPTQHDTDSAEAAIRVAFLGQLPYS